MQRRHFLTSSLAAAAVALAPNDSQAQAPSGEAREYYELRKYQLPVRPESKLLQSYLADALIPALNRMGFSPIEHLQPRPWPRNPSRLPADPLNHAGITGYCRVAAGKGRRIYEGRGALLGRTGNRAWIPAESRIRS